MTHTLQIVEEPKGWAFIVRVTDNSRLTGPYSYIFQAGYGYATREEAEYHGNRAMGILKAGAEYEAMAARMFATGMITGISTVDGKMQVHRRGNLATEDCA